MILADNPAQKRRPGPLFAQLAWFIRLRWLAALVVIVGAWVDHHWLHYYPTYSAQILLAGIAIAFYNGLLWWTLRAMAHQRGRRWVLISLTWAQLLLDMTCLTLLILWTGDIRSPLTPFIVLHMVFASLLLPTAMAYAGAVVVIGVYLAALQLAGHFPTERTEVLLTIGRMITLLTTVHLANHITLGLRRQRRRLIKQNRRIREMTRQLKLQHKALIQQEKMAAMGQMAAGVTHEIANPLASMDGLLQLLQRKPDRIRPEAVQTLREQIERINQIIQQMKTFAHPADMQQQTADLNEVVEQSIHILRFDARLKSVQIDRQYAPDAGSLTFLPQALQQVLVNLIVNAFDAMAQTEKPTLTIRTARQEEWCVVEVTDNGAGIAPQNMGRLFEPFFTTKPVGKGTGLGLSISYSLVQKQGGSITVRSQEGAGTSFTIRLPASGNASRKREGSGTGVAVSENPST